MARFIPVTHPHPSASPLNFIGGKPRLRRRFGIWGCRIPGTRGPIGCGYSPSEAYRDFIAQVLHPLTA